MPTYVYEAKDLSKSCEHCKEGFDISQSISDPPLDKCPVCGNAVVKVPCAAAIGRSMSSLDDRAKAAGFSKLKRLGKGEYERQY